MSDFLADMSASSQARVADARQERSEDALWSMVERTGLPPRLALSGAFDVIAEIKGHSPAEGALADHGTLDRRQLASSYADAGAVAVSVLTEPDRFAGSLEHLAEVAGHLGQSRAPAMRKDFVTAAYQLLEARVAGAGGVLLITAMLDDATLADLLRRAAALQLFVLLECFDADDVERSKALLAQNAAEDLLNAGQFMLGVNTRNLRTLAVDTERLQTLAPLLPSDVPLVAESGLKVAEDVARAAELGYRVALVGSALMRSDDPAQLIRDFRAVA